MVEEGEKGRTRREYGKVQHSNRNCASVCVGQPVSVKTVKTVFDQKMILVSYRTSEGLKIKSEMLQRD